MTTVRARVRPRDHRVVGGGFSRCARGRQGRPGAAHLLRSTYSNRRGRDGGEDAIDGDDHLS